MSHSPTPAAGGALPHTNHNPCLIVTGNARLGQGCCNPLITLSNLTGRHDMHSGFLSRMDASSHTAASHATTSQTGPNLPSRTSQPQPKARQQQTSWGSRYTGVSPTEPEHLPRQQAQQQQQQQQHQQRRQQQQQQQPQRPLNSCWGRIDLVRSNRRVVQLIFPPSSHGDLDPVGECGADWVRSNMCSVQTLPSPLRGGGVRGVGPAPA